MNLMRQRAGKSGDALSYNLQNESCDWISIAMFVAAIAAYTAEYWWASWWFAFG